jgi:hypothetical protein
VSFSPCFIFQTLACLKNGGTSMCRTAGHWKNEFSNGPLKTVDFRRADKDHMASRILVPVVHEEGLAAVGCGAARRL